MPFKRYVEIGRVALVNYGKDYGRLVVIVDVLDQNRISDFGLAVTGGDQTKCGIKLPSTQGYASPEYTSDGSNNESWCQGFDGLASRCAEYYKQGARFVKWRTVVSIPCGPSALAVKEVAWGLARYAAISQALVDAPDMVRGQMNFKRLSLTDIKIDIPRIPKKKSLIAAMEAADVKNKWESSSWGRKLIVQKRRAALNDFDRFKVMLARIKRGGAIRQELAKLKKQPATA